MFLGVEFEKMPGPIHRHVLNDKDPFHIYQMVKKPIKEIFYPEPAVLSF